MIRAAEGVRLSIQFGSMEKTKKGGQNINGRDGPTPPGFSGDPDRAAAEWIETLSAPRKSHEVAKVNEASVFEGLFNVKWSTSENPRPGSETPSRFDESLR